MKDMIETAIKKSIGP